MTCIVAGDGWMAADRCISNDDGSRSKLIKLAQNPWLIAAASGIATSTLDVKRAIRKGAQLVEDLIDEVDKDSVALVMTRDGHVFRVQEKRVWSEPRGLLAAGSGGDLALGYLAALRIDSYDREAIRAALRFAASRRADCGLGTDIRRIE